MKKNIILGLLLSLAQCFAIAQLQQIEEQKAIMGIRLLSLPDYSKLKFYKIASDVSSNFYKVENIEPFYGKGYAFTEAYVMVEKGRITNIICILDKKENRNNLLTDLKVSGLHATEVNGLFAGDSLFYDVSVKFFDKADCIWIDYRQASKVVSNLTDNSGIVNLIGKRVSDNEVQQFINSIPGKYVTQKFKYFSDLVWKKNGVSLNLRGKGDTAIIWNINFFMELDLYAKEDIGIINGYTGILPYGIKASDIPLTLIDKFGKPKKYVDAENSLFSHIEYPDYFIDASYKYDKVIENRKLSWLQIRKIL